MVRIILFLILWILNISVYGNDLTISKIKNQEVFAGSRTTIYFSTLRYLDTFAAECLNLPDFAKLEYEKNGSGSIILDPTDTDIGTYKIYLNTSSGGYSNTQYFTIKVSAIPTIAKKYYIDPAQGKDNNPGTKEAPWRTLGNVLTRSEVLIESGSFVFLRSGYHGVLNFWGQNGAKVHVLPEIYQEPIAKSITFSFTNNWVVSGLKISPQSNNELNNLPLVLVYGGSSDIEVSNCYIYSFEDQARWATNEKWYASSGNGIVSSGTQCIFTGNLLKNTWFTVELKSPNQLFSYNIIDGFGADAIRGISSDLLIEYNQVKNATVFDYDHPTRPQHDDLFQSWTFSLPIRNVTIRGNQMCDIANPNLRLPSEITQGIAIFDGFAEDWIVESNLVVIHHAHGIAMYGAKNCKITNNSVIKNPFRKYNATHTPWILVNPRKVNVGGDLSTGNLVQNNIMYTYQTDNTEPGTYRSNITAYNSGTLFVNYAKWDFALSQGSTGIDGGNLEDAASIDLYHRLNKDGNIDIGCIQLIDTIYDGQPPIGMNTLEVVEKGINYLKVKFQSFTDDQQELYYRIVCDGRSIFTQDTIVTIGNLAPDQAYDITLYAYDRSNNVSMPLHVYNVTTLAFDETNENKLILSADVHDQEINSRKSLLWAYSPYLRIGNITTNYSQCAVLPFKLPYIPANYEVVGADLNVYLDEIKNIEAEAIDLYGLASRSKNDVLSADYFEGMNPNDILLIAKRFLHKESAIGQNHILDTSSTNNLVHFINNQIKNGAQAGDYIFLRMNMDKLITGARAYYSIYSADNLEKNQVPILTLVLNSTSATDFENSISKHLKIIPNPASSDHVTLEIGEAFQHKDLSIYIYDNQGKLLDKKWIKSSSSRIDLSNSNFKTGLHHITIMSDKLIGTLTTIIY